MIGEKWHGVGSIIALNAIADGVSYATLPIPSLMRAQGRAKAVAGMRIVMVLGQVIVYSLVASHGLRAFVIGKICIECGMYLISFAVLRSIFTMPVLRILMGQVGPALAVSAAVIGGMLVATKTSLLGAPLALIAGLVVFCIPLSGYLMLAERQAMLRLIKVLIGRTTIARVNN